MVIQATRFNTVHGVKISGTFFFRKMTSNQIKRFQSLDSSVEEFIDEQEKVNSKKRRNTILLCSRSFFLWKAKRRIFCSRIEQVSQRVPYNSWQNKDNGEYEPNSLSAVFVSFERRLKKKNLWALPLERRPVRANSDSASVRAKSSKTEPQRQEA